MVDDLADFAVDITAFPVPEPKVEVDESTATNMGVLALFLAR